MFSGYLRLYFLKIKLDVQFLHSLQFEFIAAQSEVTGWSVGLGAPWELAVPELWANPALAKKEFLGEWNSQGARRPVSDQGLIVL